MQYLVRAKVQHLIAAEGLYPHPQCRPRLQRLVLGATFVMSVVSLFLVVLHIIPPHNMI